MRQRPTPRVTGLLGLAVGISLLCGSPGAARAETGETACPICGTANKESADYPAKAVTTLGRGAANTLLGWTEMIRQPAQEARDGHHVIGGLGKGLRHTVMRTLGGVGELLTFWTPKVNNRYIRFAEDCPVCMGKATPAESP